MNKNGKVCIKIRSELLESDVGFTSTLIHELYEVEHLLMWLETQGSVSGAELHYKIGKLHNEAIDVEQLYWKEKGIAP